MKATPILTIEETNDAFIVCDCNSSFKDYFGLQDISVKGYRAEDLYFTIGGKELEKEIGNFLHNKNTAAANFRCSHNFTSRQGINIGFILTKYKLPGNGKSKTILIHEDITSQEHLFDNYSGIIGILKQLGNRLNAGILLENEGRKIISINKTTLDLLGLNDSPAGLTGGATLTAIAEKQNSPSGTEDFIRETDRIATERIPQSNIEFSIRNEQYITIDYTPIKLNTFTHGHFWIFRDITNRKKEEKDTRRQKEFLNTILNTIKAPIIVMNNTGQIISFNKELITATQFEPVEIIGKRQTDLWIPESDTKKFDDYFADFASSPEKTTYFQPIFDKNNTLHRFFWSLSFTLNDQNKLEYIVAAGQDITETHLAKEAYKKSEEKLRLLTENATDLICLLDMEGKFEYVSPSSKSLLGYKPEEMLKKKPDEFLHPDDVGQVAEEIEKFIIGPFTSENYEYRIRRKDGDFLWFNTNIKKIIKNGIVKFVTISRDSTEKRFAEMALRESEEKYRLVVDNINEGIMFYDSYGYLNTANNTALSLFDKSLEALKRIPLPEFAGSFIDEDHNRISTEDYCIIRSLKDKTPYNEQILGLKQFGGMVTWFSFSTIPIFSVTNQEFLGVVAAFSDISEKVAYEISREELFTEIQSKVNKLEYLNQLAVITREHEKEYSEILKQTVAILPAACRDKDSTCGRIIFQNREYKSDCFAKTPWSQSAMIISRDKIIGRVEVFYSQTSAKITNNKMHDEEQDLINYTAIQIANFHERKMTAEQLKLNNIQLEKRVIERTKELHSTKEKMQNVLRGIDEVVYSIDLPEREFSYISPATKKLFGLSPSDIQDNPKKLKSMLLRLDIRLLEKQYKILLSHGHIDFVQVITDTEGRRKFVHFLGNLIRDENNKPVRIDGSCRDQTRLTIAQLELRKSEEKFRKMIESAGEAIIITEMLTGIITEVNNRAEILLETSRQKLLGNKLVEFLLPENADFLQLTFNATKNEDKVVTPIDLKTAKDNIIPVEINSTILTIGNHFYHQGIFIDMREKRKIELELQKAIEKEKAVNKMKMKFVSTASHQFRTPLSVIQSNIDLMELKFERRKDTGYKDLKPLFDGVYAEVDLMTDIMENVLILGKLDSGRIQFAPKPADLIALCEDILSTQFNVTADSRSIDFVYSGKKQDIAIDKKLIQHVIANLLNNALKYSPGKSNPRLSIEYLDNRVTIKVVDKGIGIPDEEMKNLFQSFYRASNTEDIPGTGLGLTIVKEFIELHGGLINVTSSLNEGTVFTITFFYGVNNEKDSTN